MLRNDPRVLFSLFDQMVWSVGNLILSASVAFSADNSSQFGSYAVSMAIGLTLISLVIARFIEPISAEGLSKDTSVKKCFSDIAGICLSVSIAILVLVWVVSATWFDNFYIFIVALSLCIVVLAECFRGILIATKTPLVALKFDVTWLFVQLLLFAALFYFKADTTSTLLLAWALASLVALGLYANFMTPSLSRMKQLWKKSALHGVQFTVEVLLTRAPLQLLVGIVGLVLGSSEAGLFRLVQLVFAPLNSFLVGLRQACIPVLRNKSVKIAYLPIVFGAVAALYFALMLPISSIIYKWVGWDVMPQTITTAGFGFGRIMFAITLGYVVFSRIGDFKKLSLKPRFVISILTLTAALIGMQVFGNLSAAIWGASLGAMVGNIYFHYSLVKNIRS